MEANKNTSGDRVAYISTRSLLHSHTYKQRLQFTLCTWPWAYTYLCIISCLGMMKKFLSHLRLDHQYAATVSDCGDSLLYATPVVNELLCASV